MSQTRNNIPGGYIIIIDAIDEETNLAIYIVIKAEPHQVLLYDNSTGISKIELLDRVFLSPSQKLFKLAILFENQLLQDEASANENYGCFLFDDQFRTDGHPAEYFYKDFLGFSVGKNAKIQSKLFFDKTETFLLDNVPDYETKNELLTVLKTQFTADQNETITPSIFNNNFLPEPLRNLYTEQIIPSLAPSFVKDQTLLRSKLHNKKIVFPNNIKISGPDELFDQHVEVISDDDLQNLDSLDGQYTILKIMGKPFQHDE